MRTALAVALRVGGPEGWSYLWCATEGGGRAIVLYVFFAESKVSQDNVPLRIKQDVLWLQVSVERDERR